MSTWWLAAVAALVAAGLVALVLGRRRRRSARPPGPRTVADLVRLRSVSPIDADPAVDDAATPAGSTPTAESTRTAAPAPADVAPAPGDAPCQAAGVDDAEPVTVGAATVAAPAEGSAATPAGARSGTDPGRSRNGSGDTPWDRARRMSGAESPEPSAQERQLAPGESRKPESPPAQLELPEPPAPESEPEFEPATQERAAVEQLESLPPGAAEESVPQSVASGADPEPFVDPAPPAADRGELDLDVPAAHQVSATTSTDAVHDPARAASSDPEPDRARVLRLVPAIPAQRGLADVPPPAGADVDLALLGSLGLVDPAAEPEPQFAPSGVDGRPTEAGHPAGPTRQVRFRVTRQDGSAVPGAAVNLLDDRGQEVTTGYADARGEGELWAPDRGDYLLVCVAPEHQPGAAAVSTVDDEVDVMLLMVRSAVLSGSVRGPHGPVVAARLTLVQNGEIVDAARSDSTGSYRIADLAAGGYGLSVAAPGFAPVALRIEVDAGAEAHRDVELEPNIGAVPQPVPVPDRQVAGRR